MPTKKSTSKKKHSDDLKKEIKKLKIILKEREDRLLRCYADLQNYQKRMEKELQLKEEETKKKYISELLDLNELLKKAYEDHEPKEDLKLILNNIENFFEKEQIKSIKSVGQKFNHNLHYAVATIEKNDCEDETIIEEVKKGYTINNKLLRPCHVIVAKKKEEIKGC